MVDGVIVSVGIGFAVPSSLMSGFVGVVGDPVEPSYPLERLLQKSNTLATLLAARLLAVVNAFFNASLVVDTPGTFAVPRSTPLAYSAASELSFEVSLPIEPDTPSRALNPLLRPALMPLVNPNSPGLLKVVTNAFEAAVEHDPEPPQLIPKSSSIALIAIPNISPNPPMIPAILSKTPIILLINPRISPMISFIIPSTNVFKQPNIELSAESTSVLRRPSIILEIILSISPKLQKIILRIFSSVSLIVDVMPLIGTIIFLTSSSIAFLTSLVIIALIHPIPLRIIDVMEARYF